MINRSSYMNAAWCYQGLLQQQTEENGIAQLSECLEDLGLEVTVVHNVNKLSLKVLQHSCQHTHTHTHIGRDALSKLYSLQVYM